MTQILSSPPIHQPQPLSAAEASRRWTEGASAERPQERVSRRPRGRDDEDVRPAPDGLLAARGAGLGDGIRDEDVRDYDKIARRQGRGFIFDVEELS